MKRPFHEIEMLVTRESLERRKRQGVKVFVIMTGSSQRSRESRFRSGKLLLLMLLKLGRDASYRW
jgi:hypothetical protein